jgi:hypothetical protein
MTEVIRNQWKLESPNGSWKILEEVRKAQKKLE